MTTIVLAEREIRVISPYFVPLDEGVELLGAARGRGVRTVVMTNSLASSDVAAVHAGYQLYRKPLLTLGVELYETRAVLRAARRSRPWLRFSRGSLHAKVFLIDRRLVYVGSFNWDPRSVGINTEMGILLDSPALATRLSDLTDEWLREDSWRVELDSSGRLRWLRSEKDRAVVAIREPDAGFWRRVYAALVSLLPIRGQL